jgi:hypothetical protein
VRDEVAAHLLENLPEADALDGERLVEEFGQFVGRGL